VHVVALAPLPALNCAGQKAENVMRKLIFRLMIVLSFLLATERVKAQPAPPASYAEFIQALGSFGLGGDALRATLQGLTNLAIELGQADAALVARLRSTSSIRQLILEVIRKDLDSYQRARSKTAGQ
jgi:hypothetical protein